MNRRHALGILASAGMVSLSGCTVAKDLLEEDETATDAQTNSDRPVVQPHQSQTPEQTEGSVDEVEEETEHPSMPPVFVYEIEGHTAPDVDGVETYEKEFSYELGGETHRLSTEIPSGLVEYYESRPRHNEQWGRYVSDPHDKLSMLATANMFRQKGDTPREQANHAMRFVQTLEYTRDKVSAGISQYTAYPIETMETTEGDCEDTTLLLAEFLNALNIGSVILAFYDREHMALGVLGSDSMAGESYQYQGNSYYYAETTAPGWQLGELPEKVQGASPEISPIHDSPVLNTGWDARPPAGDAHYYEFALDVLVANNGRAKTDGVTVDVAVEKRGGEVFDQAQIELSSIPTGEVEQSSTTLEAVDNEMRISLRTSEDGVLQDRATSKWVSPN